MAGRTRHNVSEKEKPQHVVCKNVLRLAGELSIVRVLNDFQTLPILYNCSGIIQHTGKTE
ncbi:hypothetical protein FIU08_09715 [Escherichia coli]|nr:hypothetical protein [Escherichia coli]EGD9742852.1 hypothetical protein [Escherichia coli]EGE1224587.1 hypothetical protein [Escherichia coli]QCJ11986.1 hypothetical protein FA026_03325 [Escherichia coli]QDM70960.1 hypothetical protein FNJ83_13210 [Escherichia coli]